MKSTGLDIVTAKGIPAGATVKRIYWSAPHGYVNPGPEFETQAEALRHAIEEMKQAVKKHESGMNGRHLGQWFVPLPERITIDLRWAVSWPVDRATGGASGVDTTVSRTEYADIAEATQALAMLEQHRLVGR